MWGCCGAAFHFSVRIWVKLVPRPQVEPRLEICIKREKLQEKRIKEKKNPPSTDCDVTLGNKERIKKKEKKDTGQRSWNWMKQNLFIFTEQAENSQSISMTSSISALFFFSPSHPSSLSLALSLCRRVCSLFTPLPFSLQWLRER